MAEEGTTGQTEGTEGKATPQEKTSSEKAVPERDLLALKASRDNLQKELDGLKQTHQSALEEMNSKLQQAEARAEELQAKYAETVKAVEERDSIKQQLEAAQTRSKELETKALEYRRNHLATIYNIPVDILKDKDMQQLDAYEEVLKAVGGTKAGNYAVGGGSGTSPTTRNPMERALAIIQEAEERQGLARR